MSAPVAGGVFISYRREETASYAGRLYDRLAYRLGDDQVFMDVDTIAPGLDFAEVITQAVSTCEVLLAVIGPRWLSATDEEGQRRLEDPDDIVVLEIAAALERNIRVIPILVEGVRMPRRQQLPDSLARLARRNAFSVRHESFRADTDRLLEAIEPILHPPATTAPEPAQVGPGAVLPTDVVALPSVVQVLRHDDDVNAVAFSPDGRLLATSSDKTARVWEVATGEERARVNHDDPMEWVAFSPDGRLLATASDDGTARVWDWAGGQERARVTHDAPVFGVVFSPDGRLLATASDDRTARVWEVATGEVRARVTHDDLVSGVAFSPDGRLLATSSYDDSARLWALVR